MKVSNEVREFLSKIGAKTSAAKKRSSRANGKLGGMPRRYPRCPRYGSHRFSPTTGKCPCSFQRPKA